MIHENGQTGKFKGAVSCGEESEGEVVEIGLIIMGKRWMACGRHSNSSSTQ